jgi:hypothetical protein
MEYPNAAKGLKKIFLAELLHLIGAVMVVCALIVLASNGISMKTSGDVLRDKLTATGMTVPMIIYSVGTVVLLLIGLFLNLAGIYQASRDEDSFKRAMWATLFTIVVSIVGSFIQRGNPAAADWIDMIITISTMMTALLVLDGIIRIAGSTGNSELSDLAKWCSKFIIFPFVFSLVGELLIAVFALNESTIALVGAAVYVLDAVSYIMYLRVLSKARTMQ